MFFAFLSRQINRNEKGQNPSIGGRLRAFLAWKARRCWGLSILLLPSRLAAIP
jgi:hypothetical protein